MKIIPGTRGQNPTVQGNPLDLPNARSETKPACELNVLYHQIEELGTHGYRADRIMGHAIAHEIAHVLIGPAHSEEGIMRAEWTSTDFQRISWGLSLDFTRNQSTRLRNAALRRTTLAPK